MSSVNTSGSRPAKKFFVLTPELTREAEYIFEGSGIVQAQNNLLRAALATHEHSRHHPFLSETTFLALMSKAWAVGVNQHEKSAGRAPGRPNDALQTVQAFAAAIAHNEQAGLLAPNVIPL